MEAVRTHLPWATFVFDRFHDPGGPGGANYKAALTWWIVARDLGVLALYALLVLRLRRRPATSNT